MNNVEIPTEVTPQLLWNYWRTLTMDQMRGISPDDQVAWPQRQRLRIQKLWISYRYSPNARVDFPNGIPFERARGCQCPSQEVCNNLGCYSVNAPRLPLPELYPHF